MHLEIVPVSTRQDLRRFVDVPWRISAVASDPTWVPPLRLAVLDALDTHRNPFYKNADVACFLALRDGKPVGRIAAIENRAHNAFHGDRVGFFGFFECTNDTEAAARLFDTAGDWLRQRGLTTMRGPVSPSTNYETGLLVDGYREHPYVMTTWNPPYYETLVSGAGFTSARDLIGYWIPADDAGWRLPERYAQHAERLVRRSGITFRDLDLSQFEREVALCWDIYNAAWEKNWGFVPMAREEFWHMAKDLKQIAIPEFAIMAEIDGEPAGFMLVIPDLNVILKRVRSGRLLPTGLLKILAGKSAIRSLRVLALGVKEKYRTRGIYQLFAHELYRRGRAWGATGAEASWILENNRAMAQPLEDMGCRPYRRWRIYDRPLQEMV